MKANARDVWLTPYLKLQQAYDVKIANALLSSANSAAAVVKKLAGKQGIGATVRQDQLTQAQSALHSVLATMFKAVQNTIQAGQHSAAAQALSSGFDWDADLLQNVYKTETERNVMRNNLIAAAPYNIEALIIRLRKGGLPLSQQVYKTEALAKGWLNNSINDAVGRGASWKELSNEVKKFINPSVQGGVSYAANRLARTEINNAYHAVAQQDMANKPWVTDVDWELSKSHPRPDVCNAYAQASPYVPDAVPAKPHPQCFCYIVPRVVSNQEFLQGYRNGLYDSYLKATYHIAA